MHNTLKSPFVWVAAAGMAASLQAAAQSPEKPADAAPVETQEQPQSPERAIAEDVLATWTTHARAIAHTAKLDETQRNTLVENYLRIRTEHEHATDDLTEEWHAYVAEELKRIQELGGQPPGGFLEGSIFDRSELVYKLDLLRGWKRKQFGEQLVKDFGEEKATVIYPLLAALEPSVDKMINIVREFELEDPATFFAVESIAQFYVDEANAKSRARQRREPLRDAIVAEREKLVARLGDVLTAEQAETFQVAAGFKRPERRRGGG